jgi:hypothetical protein
MLGSTVFAHRTHRFHHLGPATLNGPECFALKRRRTAYPQIQVADSAHDFAQADHVPEATSDLLDNRGIYRTWGLPQSGFRPTSLV